LDEGWEGLGYILRRAYRGGREEEKQVPHSADSVRNDNVVCRLWLTPEKEGFLTPRTPFGMTMWFR